MHIQTGILEQEAWGTPLQRSTTQSEWLHNIMFAVAAFAVEFWIVRTARGTDSSVTAALVDSLGFDVLTLATLAFSGIFRPQSTTKTRRYGD